MSPDSRPETLAHIARVRELLEPLVDELRRRGRDHDASKLVSPEVEVFDRFTPRLDHVPYGSPEYRRTLEAMGTGLRHHYAHNRHHPEFHADGVEGMTLIDLLEMLADWMARAGDGLGHSLEVQRERFGIPAPLMRVLMNTARECGWLPEQ